MNTNKELNYRLYLQREEEFVRMDLKSEFSYYDNIKQGNIEKVRESFQDIRKDFYKGNGTLSDHPVKNNIYHLVVSAAIVSRLCIAAGLPHDEAYTLTDIYIRKADVARTPEEVIDLIEALHIDFATRMHNLKKKNVNSLYVRRCIDYIYNHLQEPITLEKLAHREKLNPSYLSKLFSKETGVPLRNYIQNVKIETAKNMLEETTFSISDIALSLGYSSQSSFTYSFRMHTGTTPSKYRAEYNYTKLPF